VLAGAVDEHHGPARTENPQRHLAEVLLELGKRAKVTIDHFRQVLGRVSTPAAHNQPEHRVVGMATAIIAHNRADRLWRGEAWPA
jgi:hypothetical protein